MIDFNLDQVPTLASTDRGPYGLVIADTGSLLDTVYVADHVVFCGLDCDTSLHRKYHFMLSPLEGLSMHKTKIRWVRNDSANSYNYDGNVKWPVVFTKNNINEMS